MNTEQELEERISKWLNKEGYPLEMETARAFRKVGFRTVSSRHYEDPKTGKLREIDVTAIFRPNELRSDDILVAFCIECKSGDKYPWLVFIDPTNEDKGPLLPPLTGICSDRANKFFGALQHKNNPAAVNNVKAISNLPFMNNELNGYGYALTQAFKKQGDEDTSYKGLMSSINSSVAWRDSFKQFQNYDTIVFPVIVIEANLFEVYLDFNNEIQIRKIDHHLLDWHHPDISTGIHIIRKDALAIWAEKALFTAQGIINLVNENYSLFQNPYISHFD